MFPDSAILLHAFGGQGCSMSLGLAKELRQKNNNNKNQKQKTDNTTIETKSIKSGKVKTPKFNLNQNITL